MTIKKPKQIDLQEGQIEALQERVKSGRLSRADRVLIASILDVYVWLQFTLQEAKISLSRLKKFFGFDPKTEKSVNLPQKEAEIPQDTSDHGVLIEEAKKAAFGSEEQTKKDKKIRDNAVRDMTQISGQRPVVTLSRKSIAGFKIRDGYPIGCKVTLRGDRMYEFLDRLISVAIPRIRDFRGLNPRSFDGRGNYSLGIKEQIVFPEIDYDKIDVIRGLDITITTSASTDDEARALLTAFSFPLKDR